MKYNEGDIVTVKLTKVGASHLSIGAHTYFHSDHIISHTPAPFDVADAKAGMAWIETYDGGCGTHIYYYVGLNPVKAGLYVFADGPGLANLDAEGIAQMTRAPENDKVAK